MIVKKKIHSGGGEQSWLNTYADMITLVLTFFVLLYSISNINIAKLEKVAQAMQKKLGIEVEADLEEIDPNIKVPEISEEPGLGSPDTAVSSSEVLKEMTAQIEQYFNENNVNASIESQDDVVYIRFNNDLLFDPDSAVLRSDSIDVLTMLGSSFKSAADKIQVVYINGHTADAVSALNDRRLSSERADNVAIFLEDNVGFDPKKLISRGYGKNYPIADNHTKEGRERNRRVDMVIVGQDFSASEFNGGNENTFDPLTPAELPNF